MTELLSLCHCWFQNQCECIVGWAPLSFYATVFVNFRLDTLPVFRHGADAVRICDEALSVSGPADPRIFRLPKFFPLQLALMMGCSKYDLVAFSLTTQILI